MKTKSAPVADAPAPAVEPGLNLFTFDENGACTNPEVFAVKLPKGATCEILLACHPDTNRWHIGYTIAAGEDRVAAPCNDGPIVWGSREKAIEGGLEHALVFFQGSPKSKLHRKCAGEVQSQIIALGSRSPANTAKKSAPLAALPEPENLTLDPFEIEFDPHNARGEIDPNDPSVIELAETIAATGQLQPVGVRLIPTDGLPGVGAFRRQLMWGNRRLAACRLKKLPVAARVYRDISDEQARLVMQLENLQRKELDPIQEARGYEEMKRDFDLTDDEVGKQVRKSRSVITNSLRLLELPPTAQQFLAERKLTTAHGTALASYKDFPGVCEVIAQYAVEENVSAGEIEDHLLCEDELKRDGLIFKCPYSYTPAKSEEWRFRKAWRQIGWYCLDGEFWKTEIKRLSEEKKAERAKQKEREAKGAKTTAKAKKVLGPEDGTPVGKDSMYLLDLVPEDKVAKGKDHAGNACTLCLDKMRWEQIDHARRDVLDENFKTAAGAAIERGWKLAESIKKIDGTALVGLTMFRPGAPEELSGPAAQRVGAKLAKFEKTLFAPKARSWDEHYPIKLSEVAKLDPVQYARLCFALTVEWVAGEVAEGNRSRALPHLRFFAGGDIALLDEQKPKDQEAILELIADKLRPNPGDRVEWDYAGGKMTGVVKTWDEYEKSGAPLWDKDQRGDMLPIYADKALFAGRWHTAHEPELRVIERAKPEEKSADSAPRSVKQKNGMEKFIPAKKAKKGGKKK